MFGRAHLALITKGEESHYRIEKLDFVSRVGDGVIKMISKNPSLQFAGEFIITDLRF